MARVTYSYYTHPFVEKCHLILTTAYTVLGMSDVQQVPSHTFGLW
jgi:hypothetical protein